METRLDTSKARMPTLLLLAFFFPPAGGGAPEEDDFPEEEEVMADRTLASHDSRAMGVDRSSCLPEGIASGQAY